MLHHLTEPDNVAAAITVYEKITDRITGIAYSKDEKEYLRILKDIYQTALRTDAPVLWELDEKDQPTHRIKSSDVAMHIEQRRHHKSSLGPFHYYIDGILEFAVTYLKERGDRGILTRGKPGDVLEQFLTEFIHWAVNDLPTYAANSESVVHLRQRIDYLDRILKAENLFKFGTFTRGKNKTDTISNIKHTLEACLNYAEQEAERLNARDKLNVLQLETERLLLGCVNSLYYLRATPVQSEPLRLELFLQPITATEHLRQLYSNVQATHSGALLREVIHLAGVDSFGALAECKVVADTKPTHDYYNAQGQCQVIAWPARKMDMPSWITPDVAKEVITQLQNLGAITLRVAKLKALVASAYDLTGKAGDLWAYGDEQGKASLEVLLHLLAIELEQLMRVLGTLHTQQDAARSRYNLLHRVDQDKGVNPNFNKFDYHFVHCTESYARLCRAMDDITKQMRIFPADAKKRVDDQKQRFYRELALYMTVYHPHIAKRFPSLVSANADNKECFDKEKAITALHSSSVAGMTTAVSVTRPAITMGLENSLRLPVTQVGHHIILQMEEFKLAATPQIASDPVKTWNVGDNYADWVTGFMTHQAVVVMRYQTAANALMAVKIPAESKSIAVLSEQGKQALAALAQALEDTRPKWRFQWSLWPIKTAGWPFNRLARAFANAVSLLLSRTVTELKQRVATILAISSEHALASSAVLPATLSPKTVSDTERLATVSVLPPLGNATPSTLGVGTTDVPFSEISAATLLATTPLVVEYKASPEEEKAEKQLNAYIAAKSERTEQQRLFSSFMRELNREFENPRQTLFETMSVDLRREHILRLLALETLSTAMQQASQDVTELLDSRCQSPKCVLSACYRRQAALVQALLKACTTTEPAAKTQARKACLRELEVYMRYQTTHALVAVRGAGTASLTSPTTTTVTSPTSVLEGGITHA